MIFSGYNPESNSQEYVRLIVEAMLPRVKINNVIPYCITPAHFNTTHNFATEPVYADFTSGVVDSITEQTGVLYFGTVYSSTDDYILKAYDDSYQLRPSSNPITMGLFKKLIMLSSGYTSTGSQQKVPLFVGWKLIVDDIGQGITDTGGGSGITVPGDFIRTVVFSDNLAENSTGFSTIYHVDNCDPTAPQKIVLSVNGVEHIITTPVVGNNTQTINMHLDTTLITSKYRTNGGLNGVINWTGVPVSGRINGLSGNSYNTVSGVFDAVVDMANYPGVSSITYAWKFQKRIAGVWTDMNSGTTAALINASPFSVTASAAGTTLGTSAERLVLIPTANTVSGAIVCPFSFYYYLWY